jgi:hypothetical protein
VTGISVRISTARTLIGNRDILERYGRTRCPAEAEEPVTESLEMANAATAWDDRPHVAPVWYRYEDETVEFATDGRKLDDLGENPRVVISVERSEAGVGQWHVVTPPFCGSGSNAFYNRKRSPCV